MELILYALPDSTTAQLLEETLREISPRPVLNRFYTLQRFIQYIIEHRTDRHIVIATIERLKDFIALHSLFSSNDASHLILICEDSEEMIALAHELRPRFLAHGSELNKVKAVVERMLQSHQLTNGESA